MEKDRKNVPFDRGFIEGISMFYRGFIKVLSRLIGVYRCFIEALWFIGALSRLIVIVSLIFPFCRIIAAGLVWGIGVLCSRFHERVSAAWFCLRRFGVMCSALSTPSLSLSRRVSAAVFSFRRYSAAFPSPTLTSTLLPKCSHI